MLCLVALWDFLKLGAYVADPPLAFSVDADSIDPAVFGLEAYESPTAPASRVTRKSAIQVGAVKRSRDLIAGTLGTIPIRLVGPDQQPARSTLLDQPESGRARSVTFTKLYEDLLFEGVAWWRILERGWHRFPTLVERVEPSRITVAEGRVYLDAELLADADTTLIRFDSPNDPLLVAAARDIRTALHLNAAAQRNADGTPPIDYFTPAEGADPADDDEILDLLTNWKLARNARSTGYVPAALKYNVGGYSPKDLQLAEARQHAVLEIARHAGIDPEELGVSTTSRTYQNEFGRRKAFTDFTLGAYRQAVADRLSMNDLTPTGYRAEHDLDDFLRSDPLSRMQTHEIGLRVGAITGPEIRAAESRPPLTPEQELQTMPRPAQPATAHAAPARTFSDPASTFLRLDAPQDEAAFSVDVARRTITGLAVPYGVAARSAGQLWQFSQGTLTWSAVSRVKLWVGHEIAEAVGVAVNLDDRPEGLFATFRVARGEAGDRALSLAEDQVLDGLSVGLGHGGKFATRDGINHAITAPLTEISLTPAPAFADARVHHVAASAHTESRKPTMPCTICNTLHAAGVTECPTTEASTFAATAGAADFTALTRPITEAISAGFAGLVSPQGGPATVPAGGALEIHEPLPYRFDGRAGAHSFTADLRSSASGDNEARQRLETFMGEAFAVTVANVASLNPTENRPELYVPQLEFTRPLWSMVSQGTIDDKTPFTVPKFSSSAGLVVTHSEGVEPTPGSFSATVQTVTPTPISGKIEINREVWDQGGNPQSDAIIWREMVNGYYEAAEAGIATLLNGLAIAEQNLASAVDAALITALQGTFLDLQYVRGGNRFTSFAADKLLFKALANAKDTAGRNLLPVLNPMNGQGTVDGSFSEIAFGSQRIRAAWALNSGVDNAANSFLFVPSSVWCWLSPPKRFTFEYQVKSVDMAVWGYRATACLRDSDVKRIDYTTADV